MKNKKILAIALLTLGLLCKSLQAVPNKTSEAYVIARQNLKERMYVLQSGLMAKSRYMSFIDKYLQNAELQLSVVKHLSTKASLNVHDVAYFNALLQLNVAIFNCDRVGQAKNNLKNAMQKIQENDSILTIDLASELTNTERIIRHANEEFKAALNGGSPRTGSFFDLFTRPGR